MKFIKPLLVALSVGAAWPASAGETFDFSSASGSFQLTNGVACTGDETPGDMCSSDIANGSFGGSLVYQSGSVTATISANNLGLPPHGQPTAVVQLTGDQTSPGGLGVLIDQNVFARPLDSIDGLDILSIRFDSPVLMQTLGITADDYPGGAPAGSSFMMSVDGGAFVHHAIPQPTGLVPIGATGTWFTLAVSMPQRPGERVQSGYFYVDSITVAPVPEPQTYALMIAGLAAIGGFVRRRTARQSD